MNVEQVEYQKIGPNMEGVRVTFTYDIDANFDMFDVFGEPEASMVWNMIQQSPDPLQLLCALRSMTKVTLH